MDTDGVWEIRGGEPRAKGELDVDEKKVKVAQEYQVVYAVDLDANGKLDYKANTLRSERDCLASGYEIRKSRVFEN